MFVVKHTKSIAMPYSCSFACVGDLFDHCRGHCLPAEGQHNSVICKISLIGQVKLLWF